MEQDQKFVRVAVSKRLRFDVFKRDAFTCQYCGGVPPSVVLHCDHIEPVAGGGTSEIDNLVTACSACNLGKGAVPLSVIPQSLADRAAEVIEREAQVAGYQEVLKAKRMRLEADAQNIVDFFCDVFSRDSIPRGHYTGIKTFIDRLGLQQTLDAADLADGRYPYNYNTCFRYFCGICWNQIRDQEGRNG